MTDARPPHYWLRHTDGEGAWTRRGPVPGEDLAALRRGIGREPGTVPPMWPHYTQLDDAGHVTPRLRAEHLALTLFAVHQQSQARPVHRTGVGLGTALLALRRSGKFSEEALDRRVGATATATSVGEVARHLRGLITQLRSVDVVPGLDYTRLFRDLWDWDDSERRAKVRRRWGAQYFAWPRDSDASTSAPRSDLKEKK
jgi:CRISPR system Cascade subunit CasB